MIDSFIIFSNFAGFLKNSVYKHYDPKAPSHYNQIPTFIDKTIKNLKINVKRKNGEIVFYQIYGDLRIEIILKEKSKIKFKDLKCRIIDYNSLWNNRKYIVYSDITEDNDKILKKELDNSVLLKIDSKKDF
jgi:hypothetical protein